MHIHVFLKVARRHRKWTAILFFFLFAVIHHVGASSSSNGTRANLVPIVRLVPDELGCIETI